MKTAAEHAMEVESAFLAGVQTALGPAQGRIIAGKRFTHSETDRGEAVRAAMIDRRVFDRDRYAKLPHGRTIAMHAFERRWLLFSRLKSITLATVIAPPEPLLEGDGPAPPVTASQLVTHLREIMGDSKTTHLIGVCSPSGFTEDVWRNPPELANVRLVLVEPRANGGFRTTAGDAARIDPRFVKLFDPEGVLAKLRRIREELAERSIDLLMGGLSSETIAKRLDVPLPMVRTVFSEAAKADPELKVSKQSGDVLLFRGAAVLGHEEKKSMSISDWVRSLFAKEGDESDKINVLSEKRAALSSRLDRMYDDIGKLEKREDQLTTEGKAATAQVVKRRVAGQIGRLRKDISRLNTAASLMSKQINIISTHIHNLELSQTGSIAELPSSEELTQAAVNAEEMLEQLNASDDLVNGLDINMAESSISEDEAAILKELEGDAKIPAEKTGVKTEPSSSSSSQAAKRERGQGAAEA